VTDRSFQLSSSPRSSLFLSSSLVTVEPVSGLHCSNCASTRFGLCHRHRVAPPSSRYRHFRSINSRFLQSFSSTLPVRRPSPLPRPSPSRAVPEPVLVLLLLLLLLPLLLHHQPLLQLFTDRCTPPSLPSLSDQIEPVRRLTSCVRPLSDPCASAVLAVGFERFQHKHVRNNWRSVRFPFVRLVLPKYRFGCHNTYNLLHLSTFIVIR
jgi:hypothetical protein